MPGELLPRSGRHKRRGAGATTFTTVLILLCQQAPRVSLTKEKVKIAVRLRRETLVTVEWIAERLRMGSVANVNTLLYHRRKTNCPIIRPL
jgi:hypothetical protein